MPPHVDGKKNVEKRLSRIIDNFDDDEFDPILESQDHKTEDNDRVVGLLEADNSDDDFERKKDDLGVGR